jgi:hypothetical protein
MRLFPLRTKFNFRFYLRPNTAEKVGGNDAWERDETKCQVSGASIEHAKYKWC